MGCAGEPTPSAAPDAIGDLGRDPQARRALSAYVPSVAVVVAAAGRHEAELVGDLAARTRPWPRRTSGSRPRGRRDRPRPARGRPRSAPAPRRNGRAPAVRRRPGSPRSPRPGRARRAARTPGIPHPSSRRNASSTLVAWPAAIERPRDGRAAERVVVGRPRAGRAGRRSTGRARAAARPSARSARGAGRAGPASAASNASSAGSIPNPRMWSSPSHSPRSRVTMALISTPGMSVRPGGTASAATTSR